MQINLNEKKTTKTKLARTKRSREEKKPEWLTVYLDVNEPRRDQCATAIDLSMWANFLIKKYRLWINDFTILYPQIVNNNFMVSNESTILKLNDIVTRTHCGHCQANNCTERSKHFQRIMHKSPESLQVQTIIQWCSTSSCMTTSYHLQW